MRALVIAALLACLTVASAHAQEATITVIEAKKIVTMEPAMPEARVVAIRDGRILSVGRDIDDLSAWLDGNDYAIDERFKDKVLMPGLIDPHVHPMFAFFLPFHFITPEGWELSTGVSSPSRTPEDYTTRLSEAISAHKGEGPFFTWGYHQLWHGELDRAALDEMSGETPVFVWHRSQHEIIMNSAAIALLGLDDRAMFEEALAASHADPAHIDYDNGHFFETGLQILIPRLRPYILSPERLAEGFSMLKEMMRTNGVTTISDMATGVIAGFEAERTIVEQAFDDGEMRAARVMLVPDAASLAAQTGSLEAAAEYIKKQTVREAGPVFVNNRVKLFTDGAFFSQYMQMGPPGYSDGHEGKWMTEPDQLRAFAEAFWRAGVNIHIHVNGDAGLDLVLDILDDLRKKYPHTDQQFTLEHFGYSREDQNRRVAALGANVSAQPNYVYVLSDKYAEQGLGYDRASQMSRLGSLEDKDVTIALHSDLTIATLDPLNLAWIAANRKTMEGTVMAPEERLSLHKALRAVTVDAAYVLGLDDELGSIAAGKRADFAVLDKDPYKAGAKGLRDIDISGVIFEGEAFVDAP